MLTFHIVFFDSHSTEFIYTCINQILYRIIIRYMSISSESKRVYKRLLRSCLKQKPSNNVANFYQPERHVHLYRTPSTPSLKRRWICHRCGLENNSVAWHCLNCECVSLLAPIYKGTLAKEQRPNQEAAVTTSVCEVDPTASVILNPNKPAKMMNHSNPASDPTPAKCHLCLYKTKPSGPLLASASGAIKEPLCRHQHHHNRMRSKYLRFPMIGAEQKSFDEAKYYVQDGLYFSNRKINKSLSNITDLFGGHPLDRTDDAVFGERVFKSQRPNSLVVNDGSLRRTSSKGTINSGSTSPYIRQLSVPNGESDQFRDFVGSTSPSTRSLSSGSGSLQRRSQCDVCGVCNQTRCSSNSGESTGRFTITTLSRSDHLPGSQASTLKNRTLPRNGGVFVAVGNWTTTTDDNHRSSPAVIARPNNVASSADVSYYEVLKNPNFNNNQPLYETPITMPLHHQPQQHLYENHQPQMPVSTKCEPIYAVVNKMNKTGRHHRSFEQPSPSAAKSSSVGCYADDQMYASIGHYGNNNARFDDGGNVLGGGGLVGANVPPGDVDVVDGCAASSQLKSSHITITSSVDEPGSDTSDIYAKVWKGPRKSLDSQKM